MRTETFTITKTYYTYDELRDEAKENVRRWYIDDPLRNDFFYDDLKEDLSCLFPDSKMDARYQLCYCQGDGLSITGSLDWTDMFDAPKNAGKAEFWDNYTEKEQKRLKWYLPKMSSYNLSDSYRRYCGSVMYQHIKGAGETAQDYANEISTYYGWRDVDTKLIRRFLVDAFGFLEGIEKSYEKWGYQYLYEPDEDEIRDMCEANNWEFDAAGNYIL